MILFNWQQKGWPGVQKDSSDGDIDGDYLPF